MFIKYLTEFIGTFIFLSVILSTGQAFPIGLALAVAIYFGGGISGGHFNPAVSTMMAAKGKLSMMDLPWYILAQVLGGLAALAYYNAAGGK
jgi:aquaporin Z